MVVMFASVRHQSIVSPVLAIHLVVVFACARYQSIFCLCQLLIYLDLHDVGVCLCQVPAHHFARVSC